IHGCARSVPAAICKSTTLKDFRIFSLLLAPFYKTTSFRELRPARAKYPLTYISKTHIIARLAAASRARRKFQCCGILGLLFHDASTASHNAASPQRASPALGHRIAAGFRGARQLFRSRESFRVARRAASVVRNFGGDVRLPVERVQLDLRGPATAFRTVAGSLWRAPRRHPQHDHLEHRILWRGHFHGNRQLIWRAISVGGWRSSDISGQRQGRRLLVPPG